MDQPKASSSKWAAARALHPKMQKYYPLRWLHRGGVVRQETGERAGYSVEMQRQNRKNTKEEKQKRRLSTVINSLWNGHSRGNTNRGDGSEVVQWPCKGGKATGTLVAVDEKTV